MNSFTEGCANFGHACFGGHGKRSLGKENEMVKDMFIHTRDPSRFNENNMIRNQMPPESQDEEKMLEQFPRYRIIKMIMNMVRWSS